MALYRMIGSFGGNAPLVAVHSDPSTSLPYEIRNAIACLVNTGHLTREGNFTNKSSFTAVEGAAGAIVARYMGNGIGWSFGEKILHGIAAVSMALPRNAFLGLVGLNAFGYATKMQKAIALPDGKANLEKAWYKLGGSWDSLLGTINHGAKKKALLKISNGKLVSGARVGYEPVSTGTAAMIAAAATVVAAIMPIVLKILNKNGQNVDYEGIDPATGQPYGTVTQPGPLDSLRNPVVIAAAAALAVYYLMD